MLCPGLPLSLQLGVLMLPLSKRAQAYGLQLFLNILGALTRKLNWDRQRPTCAPAPLASVKEPLVWKMGLDSPAPLLPHGFGPSRSLATSVPARESTADLYRLFLRDPESDLWAIDKFF